MPIPSLPPIARMRRVLARFARKEDGAVLVEFVISVPILIWAFMAGYVFYDAYRQSAVNLKAAYTISDLISRETNAITETYVDSMSKLLQMLANSDSVTRLRISVVRWDQNDNRYYVDWSRARGYTTLRSDANIQDVKDRLPSMPHAERVILVETSNIYDPPLNVGIGATDIENFVFTRPRYAPQVKFSS